MTRCNTCGKIYLDAGSPAYAVLECSCNEVDWQAKHADLLRRMKLVRKTSGCAMVTSAVDGATLQMPDMIRLDVFDAALPEGKE